MRRRIALLLLGLVILTGCSTRRLWPSDQGFPNRAIVFEVRTHTSSALGFIHPDGTGLITQNVGGGLYTVNPTWSPDGEYIAIMTNPGSAGGYFSLYSPKVISSKGEWLGECRNWEWNNGRFRVTAEGELLLTLMLAKEKRERVVLADFRSCKILTTLYEASGTVDEEFLGSADLSLGGWLAVGRIFREGCPYRTEIVVIDPVSQESQVVGNGLAPAWSPDGEWLAYTALDGIYVVNRDGSQSRMIVEVDSRREPCDGYGWSNGLPAASWSPDGKWLVYHRLTADGPIIFKASVESGEEIEIFRGGTYPDWRWDKVPEAG